MEFCNINSETSYIYCLLRCLKEFLSFSVLATYPAHLNFLDLIQVHDKNYETSHSEAGK